MCLIIIKKKGEELNPLIYKSIKKSFDLRNQDGGGFSFKRDNKIYISKGYFDIDYFIESIQAFNIQKNDELMVHLRKVSAGDKTISNCHPYVCSTDNLFQEEGYVDAPVLSHNGTFQNYITMYHSDTIEKIKDELSIPNLLNIIHDLHQISPMMAADAISLSNNKLGIMYPNKDILLMGKWIEEKKHGLFYSNTSYLGNDCPTHGMYGAYNLEYEYYGRSNNKKSRDSYNSSRNGYWPSRTY